MTGKQLTVYQRQILARLLRIDKLTNRDIATVLEVDERTIRRRRDEFMETGDLRAHKDVSKNAEKFKPEAVAKLVEWLKDHDDALLEDCQLFLKRELGLEVSLPTISRNLVKATGKARTRGRARRVKQRREGTRVELDIALGRRRKDGEDEEDEEGDDEEASPRDRDSSFGHPNQSTVEPALPLQPLRPQPPYQHQAFQLAPPDHEASRPRAPQSGHESAQSIHHPQAFLAPRDQLHIQGQPPFMGR